jgi:hypothetical protein
MLSYQDCEFDRFKEQHDTTIQTVKNNFNDTMKISQCIDFCFQDDSSNFYYLFAALIQAGLDFDALDQVTDSCIIVANPVVAQTQSTMDNEENQLISAIVSARLLAPLIARLNCSLTDAKNWKNSTSAQPYNEIIESTYQIQRLANFTVFLDESFEERNNRWIFSKNKIAELHHILSQRAMDHSSLCSLSTSLASKWKNYSENEDLNDSELTENKERAYLSVLWKVSTALTQIELESVTLKPNPLVRLPFFKHPRIQLEEIEESFTTRPAISLCKS